MKEISNDAFCELSQEELLSVAGGQNVLACTGFTLTGGMLFGNCVSIGVAICPPVGIAAGLVGAAFLGAGIHYAN